MATKLAINFSRLLSRSEEMAQNEIKGNWRLEQYVSTLQGQLNELKRTPGQLTLENIESYSKRVEVLKGLIEAEKLPTSAEKAMATEWLPQIAEPRSLARELQVKAKVQNQQAMRAELLGSENARTSSGDSGLRQRTTAQEEDDINAVLQHQRQQQERLAEEMVNLARCLKQNVTQSGDIIRKDTQMIGESTRTAQTNLSKLKVEGDRLEKHTRSCSCWVYFMVVLVVMVMIWTILFIRLFPKKF